MKFLLDSNLSHRVAQLLRDAGFGYGDYRCCLRYPNSGDH